MSNFAVVFTTNNAVLIKNTSSIPKKMPNMLISPDLSEVNKVNTKFWKLRGNKIKVMTNEEMKQRLKHIGKHAEDTNIRYLHKYRIEGQYRLESKILLGIVLLVVLCLLFK